MFDWTDERAETVRRLWIDSKKTATQIAMALGGDVTRNAVIGKIHRLGLMGRPKREGLAAAPHPMPRAPKVRPIAPHSINAANIARKAAARARDPGFAPEIEIYTRPLVEDDAILLPMSPRVTFADLHPAMCKFPFGDPRTAEFRFCGAPAVSGPYCGFHHRISYDVIRTAKSARVGFKAMIERDDDPNGKITA
jgi:GcrA cell cycle regulator